jgi:hypothetical protein
VTIGFSEKLKSIKYFETFGLNLTGLNTIAHQILDVRYHCKQQERYDGRKLEEEYVQKLPELVNWWVTGFSEE